MPNILLKKYDKIFSCVYCHQSMLYKDNSSLICANNHNFDISKYGHVNFITHTVKNYYDKTMLERRRRTIKAGLFDELLDTIKAHIKGDILLDAGCGEGSQLQYLIDNSHNIHGFGIDLSKDGIILGAKSYKNLLFSVGDIANMPFGNKSIDSIVNILSPANYKEFFRILKPDGLLIKAVPNSNYLVELRQFFYKDTDKEDYSNVDVIDIFSHQFSSYKKVNSTYNYTLTSELLENIISMSPLFWNLDKEVLPTIEEIPNITMDFTILIGSASKSTD